MLSVLHSLYRPACLTLLAFLGLVCGHLIDTVLQVNLRPDPAVERPIDQIATAPASKTSQSDLNLILQNNIFDAGNRSATATMTRLPASANGEDAATAVRTELKLFGTVVVGERSQALIEANKELKIYHLGDKVAGEGTIEDIQRKQVNIKNRDQSLTTLTLYEKAPSAAHSKASNNEPNREAAGDVRAVGENRWLISRTAVEAARENFADQLRLAQMQPRTVNGKTDGFLLQRINPRSLLVKLGLQRGDVIIDVNNIKLDSPEKALQVFQQLREARQISVAIERNGQPMSFAYEIE